MGEVSLAARLYDEVQFTLTHLLDAEKTPTTQDLMQLTFKGQYNPDSRKQRDTIYTIIMRGRDDAILNFETYAVSQEFTKDIANIDYYEPPQTITEDYAEYNSRLYEGYFGNETKILKQYEEELKPMATLWEKKINEYSHEGNNLVVATYGPNSKWVRPTYWWWAIRERDLYLRSAKILVKQIQRGIDTRIALPDLTNLNDALITSTEMKQLLEYKSKIPS